MEETVFVRKATGLVREIGLVSAILFGLTYSVQIFSGACCVIPYFTGYGNYVGNYWLAVGIALVAALLINSVYAHFSSAMPRSGGDYVFLSRTMHPLLGFAPSWSFLWIASTWNAFNLLFFASVIPLFASAFFPQAALGSLSSPGAMFALGMILWVFGLITLTGLKWFSRLQYLAWAIQIAAITVTAIYMLTAVGHFPALFNNWALKYVPTQPDMYHAVINSAVKAGFVPNPPPEGPAMSSTLSLAVVLIGQSVPYQAGIIWIAGEVKKAESVKRQHVAMMAACILAFGLAFVGTSLPWILAAGPRFMGAFYYLGGSISGLPTTSWVWSLFPAVMPTWAVSFYGLAAMMASIVVYMVGIIVVSRILFAWSFDRMVPAIFAHVGERRKTPPISLAVAYVIAAVLFTFLIFAPQYTYFGALFFFVLLNVFIVCVAGLVFPYVRKDMFERMPLKVRIAGIPVLSIISLLGILLLGWMATSYFTNTAFMASYGITFTAVAYGMALWVTGIMIYFISRAYNKRRGIDLEMAFRQIPPA